MEEDRNNNDKKNNDKKNKDKKNKDRGKDISTVSSVDASFLNLHELLTVTKENMSSSIHDSITLTREAIGIIGGRHRELLASIGVATDVSHMSSGLFKANDTLLGLAGQFEKLGVVSFDPTQIDKSWFEVVRKGENLNASMQSIAGIDLSRIAYETTITEGLYSRINLSAIDASFGLSKTVASVLNTSYFELTKSYQSFANSIIDIEGITRLPRDITLGANREVFLAGYVLDSLAPEKTDESKPEEKELYEGAKVHSSEFASLLDSIDPALTPMFYGAEKAYRGSNPDRVRHVLSSTRELWSNLMWKLAPEKEVINWIPEGQSDLIKDGKPTRRARILYICRSVNSAPLSKVVNADAEVFVLTYDLLNRVHTLEPGFNDTQLEMILIRTKCFLKYLIEISHIRN